MSMDAYKNEQWQLNVCQKLMESEDEEKRDSRRFSHKEVMETLDKIIAGEDIDGLE
jgi:hypothetical protein